MDYKIVWGWSNYKELVTQPTEQLYYFENRIYELGLLAISSQFLRVNPEKIGFPMLVYSKSIFLHPIN
jgi:hypothetical protein